MLQKSNTLQGETQSSIFLPVNYCLDLRNEMALCLICVLSFVSRLGSEKGNVGVRVW